jgi:hypothetical protein
MADKWYKWDTSQSPKPPRTTAEYWDTVRNLGGLENFKQAFPGSFDPQYRWWMDKTFGGTGGVKAGAPTTSPAINQGIADAYNIGTAGNMYQLGGTPVYGIAEREKAQLAALQGLMGEFGSAGSEATWVRWLIGKEIETTERAIEKAFHAASSLYYQRWQAIGEAEKVGQEFGTYTGQQAVSRAVPISVTDYARAMGLENAIGLTEADVDIYHGNPSVGMEDVQMQGLNPEYTERAKKWGGGRIGAERLAMLGEAPVYEGEAYKQTGAPPIPEWMKPYLEPSLGKVGEVRPIGAQAKLDSDQMARMAGFQAWSKVGAPTSFSKSAITAMSDIGKWWTPLVAQSQKLFPSKVKLGQRWNVGRQF